MRVTKTLISTAALTIGLSLAVALPAAAHKTTPTPPSTTVLTTAVGAPFNLEVDRHRILVADGGPGVVGAVKSDGTVQNVVTGATGTAGVATSGRYLAYTTTVGGPPTGPITASGVTITGQNGFEAKADTLAFETANNPDASISYGVANASQCVSDQLTKLQLPVSYTGHVDSHAYSLLAYGKRFVLADAGANALLWVTKTGQVSTLAVLPAQPFTFTSDVATALNLDSCIVGTTYNFEAVPTDVEVGRDGMLYVTTLAGGPESPALGARSKVYRVNPWSGSVKEYATGLLGATNLAISDGKIYVAELFAGRISVVKNGQVSEYLALPGALAVEAGRDGKVYASTGITVQQASVVKVTTSGKGWHRHRR